MFHLLLFIYLIFRLLATSGVKVYDVIEKISQKAKTSVQMQLYSHRQMKKINKKKPTIS